VRRAVGEFGAEVVLLDDGFQHLAVKRDFDIVLLDAKRPFGNGHVLPAGLLREPVSALRRGDLFVLTRCDEQAVPLSVNGPLLHSHHLLDDEAQKLQGDKVPLNALQEKQGVAFAGIAEPESFFGALRSKGLNLIAGISLGDHCAYRPEDLQQLRKACNGADYLITTEKDGVKLSASRLPLPCYQVPMTLKFHEEGALEEYLRPFLESKEQTS
jgi:tetraacyldisaccharide 4'-kinase